MSKIVFVYSFRQGTGKTTVCLNLAALLAQAGKRVGLVDGNLMAPGLHLPFTNQHGATAHDFLRGNCALEAIIHEATPREGSLPAGSLTLARGSDDPVKIAGLQRGGFNVDAFNEAVTGMAALGQLDLVLVDGYAGLNETTLATMAIADLALVLLRPDHQDFVGTAVSIDLIRKMDLDRGLLLNIVPAQFDHDATRQQIAATFATPVMGLVPYSEAVVALGSNRILALSQPDHPLVVALKQLAATL